MMIAHDDRILQQGLKPSSQALAFYCPWLSTKYAFKCPASWICLGLFFLVSKPIHPP
jgi:hypothetical protein